MAAAVSEDILTKVSTDATTEFVENFYAALQNARHTISSFYAPVVTTILFNGNTVPDGASVQDIFVNQMPPTHYEVQSYDCQVINANYITPGVEPSAPKPASGRHGGSAVGAVAKTTSILVLVSGYVRFGEERTKETWDLAGNRGFSETIVLVPNPVADRGRGMRQWLIQSQNFRLVV